VRFSELHGICLSDADDWFDPYLPADTALCVDPFLIYPDAEEPWFGAHNHILDFFAVVFDLVRQSKGDVKSLAWKKAQSLLLFPEPAEFCLGLADGSPNGSGASFGLQEGMLDGVKTALGLDIDNVPHMEMLGLFQGGMGLDRMSDAVCNIAKSYFIRYTQDVARRHGVPMQTFRVQHAAWSAEQALWLDQDVDLPVNPFLSRPAPVLLVPKRFLKDIPVVTANGFWSWAWSNHADTLRVNFNYAIARRVDRWEKAKLARQNPQIVAEYLKSLEHEDHEPYDVDRDRGMRTTWWEKGGEIAAKATTSFVPSDLSEFPQFVGTIIDIFKHGVEHQDEWQQLWHRGISMPEKKVQSVFRSCAKHYCQANDVALIGEANAGRGPVDFEFARGWRARSVVEMKLVSNTKFWDGILAQTPQYAISADVNVVYFVAIAYTDEEMADSVTTKVIRAAKLASDRHEVDVRSIIIDARPKQSASRLKPSQELRDELHQGTNDLGAPDGPDEDSTGPGTPDEFAA